MPVSSTSQHRSPSCVTCSVLAPCTRALTRLLRVPASAALSIRAFRFRSLRKTAATMSPQRRRRRREFRSVRAVFWPLVPPPSSTPAASAAGQDDAARGSAEMTTELLAAVQEVPAPMPSPETPAYMKVVAQLRSGRSAASGDDGEEDDNQREKEEACRSFETCLMEMLVEEGKARDLQDVEELLQCWERLKSPVFVDLVCRFYGELCNDMFPVPATGDDDDMDRVGGEATARPHPRPVLKLSGL